MGTEARRIDMSPEKTVATSDGCLHFVELHFLILRGALQRRPDTGQV